MFLFFKFISISVPEIFVKCSLLSLTLEVSSGLVLLHKETSSLLTVMFCRVLFNHFIMRYIMWAPYITHLTLWPCVSLIGAVQQHDASPKYCVVATLKFKDALDEEEEYKTVHNASKLESHCLKKCMSPMVYSTQLLVVLYVHSSRKLCERASDKIKLWITLWPTSDSFHQESIGEKKGTHWNVVSLLSCRACLTLVMPPVFRRRKKSSLPLLKLEGQLLLSGNFKY